ncbi:uncharacterized protein LOC143625837 [Bidens hawaiensis]|uniref:uncharacterized protein LOC143625837 n=1 Tax=Bidens hawaiensis TaxID=980011 RepID=UPI0040492508
MGDKAGILCDGTLNWFMANKNSYNKTIISLDLSTEELKEIPLPKDGYYRTTPYDKDRLGIIHDCLCIYSYRSPMSFEIRVMKNNNWELYIDDDCQQSKYDVAHCLSRAYDSRKGSFKHSEGQHVPCNGDYIRSSIFVKSLVSPNPHVDNTYEGPNKEGQEDNEGAESGVKGSIRKKKRNMSKTS